MKNVRLFFMNTLCLTAVCLTAQAQSESATDIIRKSDSQSRGNSSASTTVMQIVRPKWEREITFKSWAKGRDYAMTTILEPAKEKGQSFLKRKNEMWSWNPTISRTIKLPASMMSQGWMGSDYTNDDILKESSVVEDYTPSIMGEETVNNHNCYKLELKAKPDAPVVWGRMIKWVTKDSYIQIKTEYYDEYNTLMRTDNVLEIKMMGGRDLATTTEIIPADKAGSKTVVTLKEIQFDMNINESIFSLQNLKNLK